MPTSFSRQIKIIINIKKLFSPRSQEDIYLSLKFREQNRCMDYEYTLHTRSPESAKSSYHIKAHPTDLGVGRPGAEPAGALLSADLHLLVNSTAAPGTSTHLLRGTDSHLEKRRCQPPPPSRPAASCPLPVVDSPWGARPVPGEGCEDVTPVTGHTPPRNESPSALFPPLTTGSPEL